MRDNEIKYLNAMAQAKSMLSKGIIRDEEYIKIETAMASRYSLNKRSLYRVNDLIKSEDRAMYMIQEKEERNGEDNATRNQEQTS